MYNEGEDVAAVARGNRKLARWKAERDDDLEAHVADELARDVWQCRDKQGRFRSNHCWHLFEEDGIVACCNCPATVEAKKEAVRGE